jgi:hypothetical protein
VYLILEKSIITGVFLPEILSRRIEYPGPFKNRLILDGGLLVNELLFGILAYLTGYFMSVSKYFPKELRYQKTKERRRKKAKTRMFPFFTLNSFLVRFDGRVPSFLSTQGQGSVFNFVRQLKDL